MKTWLAISALLLAAVSGVNLADTARRTPPPARAAPGQPANAVMRQEARFAAVRRALARHAVQGTVTYVADLPPDGLAADHRSMEDYFLAQFALVPWVLDARRTDGGWAVANLRTTRPEERIPAGFRVLEDFGDGVLLLRKGAP